LDNILLTDDEAVAKEWAEKTLTSIKGEKAAYDKAEEERKAELAKNKDSKKEGENDDVESEELDGDHDDDAEGEGDLDDEENNEDHVHDEL